MVNSLISYQTRLMTRNYQRGWQILSKEMIRPMFRVVLKEEFILPKALINGLVKWIIIGKTLQRRLLCLPVLSPPRNWILTSDSSLTLPIGEATSGFYNVLIPELWDSKANAVAKCAYAEGVTSVPFVGSLHLAICPWRDHWPRVLDVGQDLAWLMGKNGVPRRCYFVGTTEATFRDWCSSFIASLGKRKLHIWPLLWKSLQPDGDSKCTHRRPSAELVKAPGP